VIYAITYKVTERSSFQAYIEAESADEAMQELHEMARDNGGDYTAPGAWISTDGTEIDPDSFVVQVAEAPGPAL
jgi:hypothetical protein